MGDKATVTRVNTRSHVRCPDAASHTREREEYRACKRRYLPVLLLVAVLAKPLLPLVRRDFVALALASAGHSVVGFVLKEPLGAVWTAFKIRITGPQNQQGAA